MHHNTQPSAGCSSNHPPSNKPRSLSSFITTNRSRSSYKGVRRRKSSGKWVSEIREPKKPTRIWLGSYPTQEMAAVAYDVAALALKGPGTQLNFPETSASLPVPQSNSSRDIQAAAASAAAAAGAAADALNLEKEDECLLVGQNDDGSAKEKRVEECFVDEDLIFDMPNVLVNMAQGMLLSPPRLDLPNVVDEDDDVANSSSAQNLWNHP